jgi:hypothetical protein
MAVDVSNTFNVPRPSCAVGTGVDLVRPALPIPYLHIPRCSVKRGIGPIPTPTHNRIYLAVAVPHALLQGAKFAEGMVQNSEARITEYYATPGAGSA